VKQWKSDSAKVKCLVAFPTEDCAPALNKGFFLITLSAGWP